MKEHELKTWNQYFEEVYQGRKTFEIRVNDRDFKIGDTLILREYDPESNTYSGRIAKAEISYILSGYFAISPNYVVLALKY